MSAERSNDTERSQAAVFFTGLMTLAAGGAGLVLAGLIVGFDYLLHGQPDEREALAEQRSQNRRDRYADALAWLEADRIDRARTRAAVRDWFEADRHSRGDRPTGGETAGRFAARVWNNLLVGAFRFRRGWTNGRDEARERREAGDKHWWRPTTDRVDETPAPRRPEPAPKSTPPAGAEPSKVVDAEIIPEPTSKERSVVPVGTDAPRPADSRLNGHEHKLQALRTEVDQIRGRRNDDPSPPPSALR